MFAPAKIWVLVPSFRMLTFVEFNGCVSEMMPAKVAGLVVGATTALVPIVSVLAFRITLELAFGFDPIKA